MGDSLIAPILLKLGSNVASLAVSSPIEVLFTLRQVQYYNPTNSQRRANEETFIYSSSTEKKIVHAEKYLSEDNPHSKSNILDDSNVEDLLLSYTSDAPSDAQKTLVDGECLSRVSEYPIIERNLSSMGWLEGIQEILASQPYYSLFKGNLCRKIKHFQTRFTFEF